MLALVLPDRYLLGPVGEDVGCLEHRVEEQAGRDQLPLPGRLLLELVHPVEVTVGTDGREQPAELGVLVDVGLPEQDAPIRLQA